MVKKDCDVIGADCPDVLMKVLAERRNASGADSA
jgi:hypothetical protein